MAANENFFIIDFLNSFIDLRLALFACALFLEQGSCLCETFAKLKSRRKYVFRGGTQRTASGTKSTKGTETIYGLRASCGFALAPFSD